MLPPAVFSFAFSCSRNNWGRGSRIAAAQLQLAEAQRERWRGNLFLGAATGKPWEGEWGVGATHRNTGCHPGPPVWHTQRSKESHPRSPVGGGPRSAGPAGATESTSPSSPPAASSGAGPHLGGAVAPVAGLGDVVDVLPTCHKAGVHVGHLPLHQLHTKGGHTSAFLLDTLPSYQQQISSSNLTARMATSGHRKLTGLA